MNGTASMSYMVAKPSTPVSLAWVEQGAPVCVELTWFVPVVMTGRRWLVRPWRLCNEGRPVQD